jgi:NADPH-dependent glutamate synthase beta subunit-like oxidoreductase
LLQNHPEQQIFAFLRVKGSSLPMDFDVTIVGAGPFGLSTAAFLMDKGWVSVSSATP